MKNDSLSNFLKKLDTKQGRQIVVILTVLLAAYMGYSSLKPSYDAANQAKSQAASTRTATEELQKEYNTLIPQLQNSKASDISSALNIAMPTQVDNVNVDKLLSNLATQTGVQINTFTPGQVSEGTVYQTLPVTLTISGSYANCIRFMNGMQNMVSIKGNSAPKAVGPIWAITSVSLTAVDASNTNMNLAANMYLTPSPSAGSSKSGSSSATGGNG
jgi:Tfp pilus assembly protein PilO